MSESDRPKEGQLVPRGGQGLVRLSDGLVARGLADLAQGRLLSPTKEPFEDGLFFYLRGEESDDDDDAIKDFDQAIRLFDVAIQLDPNNARAYLYRGKTWSAKASVGFWLSRDEVGAWDKAIEDLDHAIRIDPNSALAYYERSFAWSRMEDCFDLKIKDMNEAIRLDPNNATFYRGRARVWLQMEDYEKAIKDYDELIRLEPNRAFAFYDRGCAWSCKLDHDQAAKDFGEAIRLQPENPMFYSRRSRVWLDKKDYQEAIKDLEQIICLRPEDENATCRIAWLLATCPDERVRDAKRAIDLAIKACEHTKWEDFWMLSVLAAAYAEGGQFDEAERFQTKAIEHPHCHYLFGEEFRHRLDLYKQKKPYRQST